MPTRAATVTAGQGVFGARTPLLHPSPTLLCCNSVCCAVKPCTPGPLQRVVQTPCKLHFTAKYDACFPLLNNAAVGVSQVCRFIEVSQCTYYRDLMCSAGPNTGGKTASLKALGLAVLMAKSGLPIPAAKPAVLPCFDAVLADIGEQPRGMSAKQTCPRLGPGVGMFKGMFHLCASLQPMVKLRPGITSTTKLVFEKPVVPFTCCHAPGSASAPPPLPCTSLQHGTTMI